MNNHQYQASFGRRLGRPLRARGQQLLSNLLPELALRNDELTNYSSVQLEIGFGNGDHLLARALSSPDALFIGCEPYLNGVTALLGKIEDHAVNNIRIYTDDARLLLNALPDNILDKIYVLYPDPWPKKRQQKRRLLSDETFLLLRRKLKLTGEVIIATDHEEYAAYVQGQLTIRNHFTVACSNTPPSGWPGTKYEQKAKELGVKKHYFFILTR